MISVLTADYPDVVSPGLGTGEVQIGVHIAAYRREDPRSEQGDV